jgi:serine/threonine protein kinase
VTNDARQVDVWALGMLVFEMLVGETPFASFNDMKQILNRLDTSG